MVSPTSDKGHPQENPFLNSAYPDTYDRGVVLSSRYGSRFACEDDEESFLDAVEFMNHSSAFEDEFACVEAAFPYPGKFSFLCPAWVGSVAARDEVRHYYYTGGYDNGFGDDLLLEMGVQEREAHTEKKQLIAKRLGWRRVRFR